MKFRQFFLSYIFCFFVAACGSGDQPQSVQAIPENPADMDIAGVESVEIVPGLSKRVLLEGDGDVAEDGQFVTVHYTGWLHDQGAEKYRGDKFDSSVDRGAPFPFPLGAGRVIKGWDEGVKGMRVGEVRELTIQPDLAYGDRGAGEVIPPEATLVFVVELLELQTPGAPTDAAN